MKLRTFATLTHTFLGATLLGYGQGQQEDRGPATGSAATGGQTTRSPAGNTQTTQPASPGTGTPGNRNQGESQVQNQVRADREVDWEKADKSEMSLSEIPDRAKNTLTTAGKEGKIADKVVCMTEGNQKVFKGTADQGDAEDLHIFVKEDGTLMKTKQKVELASTPQSVRSTVETKMGKDGSAATKEVHRVIANNETTYTVSTTAETDEDKKLHIDNSGRMIEKKKMDKAGGSHTGTPGSTQGHKPSTQPPGRPGSGYTSDKARD